LFGDYSDHARGQNQGRCASVTAALPNFLYSVEKPTDEQRLMGANETAKYLGLGYWTLRELIWAGAIPFPVERYW